MHPLSHNFIRWSKHVTLDDLKLCNWIRHITHAIPSVTIQNKKRKWCFQLKSENGMENVTTHNPTQSNINVYIVAHHKWLWAIVSCTFKFASCILHCGPSLECKNLHSGLHSRKANPDCKITFQIRLFGKLKRCRKQLP